MILRTYMCEDCGRSVDVELRADQWDQEPPDCPYCLERGEWNQTRQEFVAPKIVGGVATRARDTALDIAEKDYGASYIQSNGKGEPPNVRYRDDTPGGSSWGTGNAAATHAALEQAIAIGRETRLQHGSGLDVIKTMPDLIALSKRRSAKVW